MIEKSAQDMDRRQFLKVTVTAAGGMAVCIGLDDGARAAEIAYFTAWDRPMPASASEMNAWVVIEPDDSIILRVARSEMGQGIYTTLPMFLAEELECDWSKVKVEYASVNRNLRESSPYGRMMTTGSASVVTGRQRLQEAGANARARLIAAAAARWKVDPATCRAVANHVHHPASGRSARYGELAWAAAQIKLDATPAIKTPDQFKLLGRSIPRLDTPAKVIGAAQFSIDVRLPGMVYAAVKMCPTPGGNVVRYDEAAVMKRRGVIAVVPVPGGLAVAADSFWRAKEAAAALSVTWDFGRGAGTSIEQFRDDFVTAAHDAPMSVAYEHGNAEEILSGGTSLDVTYQLPYLAHATMEPMNCTVHVQPDRVDVWIGTQWPEYQAQVAAKFAGLTTDKVFLHNCFLGGGFGRRGKNDELPQAVVLSKALGRPVKLVWTREDDFRQDGFRPQAAARMRVALGADGMPRAISSRIAVPSLLISSGLVGVLGPLTDGLEMWTADGLIHMPYDDLPALKVEGLSKNTHIPVLWWRSPSPSIHVFMVETFVDEMAYEAKIDPYQYRRRLLQTKPANLAVLDEAAKRAGWAEPLPSGSGRGIAIQDAMGTTVAEVAQVTISPKGELHIDRIVVAYDSGHVVHPKLVDMQLEGAVVFGLQATLWGEITVRDGQVVESNFHQYRMPRMADTPPIECHPVLSGGAKWGGMGEVALSPVAPAVGNAIFAATGKRLRSLPFGKAKLI
jgi:isoquinoline 1-oxidoreductase subunit beta